MASIEQAEGQCDGRLRINATLPPPYVKRIQDRCKERGVSASEALRQFMDEAQAQSLRQIRHGVREEVMAVKLVVAEVRLGVARGSPTLDKLKSIEDCADRIVRLISAMTSS